MRILVVGLLGACMLFGCSLLTDTLVGQVAKGDPLLDVQVENADGDIEKQVVVGETTAQEVEAEIVEEVVGGDKQVATTIVNNELSPRAVQIIWCLAILCFVFWELPRSASIIQWMKRKFNWRK